MNAISHDFLPHTMLRHTSVMPANKAVRLSSSLRRACAAGRHGRRLASAHCKRPGGVALPLRAARRAAPPLGFPWRSSAASVVRCGCRRGGAGGIPSCSMSRQ
jgi:hypothetical protein